MFSYISSFAGHHQSQASNQRDALTPPLSQIDPALQGQHHDGDTSLPKTGEDLGMSDPGTEYERVEVPANNLDDETDMTLSDPPESPEQQTIGLIADSNDKGTSKETRSDTQAAS